MRHLTALVVLSAGTAPAILVAQAQQWSRVREAATSIHSDNHGDPLPDGVCYRLGTTRLRHWGIKALFLSSDGSQLLTQSQDQLRLWNGATGELVRQSDRLPLNCLTASHDDRLFAATQGSTVVLMDKVTGKELAHWHSEEIWMSLAFAQDDQSLTGITADAVVYRWDIAKRSTISHQALEALPHEFKRASYRFFGLSPNGTVVAGHAPSA